MAEKELAVLLTAKNMASGPIGKVTGDIKRLDSVASRAGKGIKTAGANLAKFGLIAGGGLVVAVKGGIESLATLERMENATAAVIASTRAKAGVTAKQVRDLANAQEDLTTADDKTVQAGENMLLTFTGIGSRVFPRATAAMVNMGIAMNNGSVEGLDLSKTAIQVGKALQDPIKGATALRKAGVMLTDEQTKQIKVLVKAGKIEEAQTIILKELETEFGKAGEAAGKGFGGDMRRFQDAIEESQMALATGFLPVMSKVAKLLSSELAKPSTIASIKAFGQGLAGGLDSLITTARNLPWESIGDALRIGGMGAKAVLDAFLGMPPWVQTAVLTGWGLNKLSGGAIGGIAGELGKGLIKGVLGMNAGVVNINAGVVNGGGGLPGAGGKGIGGGFLASFLAAGAVPVALTVGTIAALGIAFVSAMGMQSDVVPANEGGTPGQAFSRGHGFGPRSGHGSDIQKVDITKIDGKSVRSSGDPRLQPGAKPLPSSGDPRLQIGALTGAIHASLDKLIGRQGGAFIASGAKNKTLDENAGKLVSLFKTSTNPSLKSMQENLKILKATAAKGDEKTRKALSDDIAALNGMIAAKLAVIATNTANTAANILAHPGVPSFVNPGGSPPNGAPPGVLNITVNASVNANAMTTAQRHTVRMGGPRRVTAS